MGNHPVLRVFAWLLEDCRNDAEARRRPDASSLGLVSATKRRVANRWHKAWYMLKNPKVATYKATIGLDVKRRKLIAKAAKHGCEIPPVGAKTIDRESKFN